MIDRIIRASLAKRSLVLILVGAVIGLGISASENTPRDSFPDLTPTMVQVFTVSPGLSPVDVETQISYPVEISMYGLPGLERVQSTSIFGLSRVNIYFEDRTDIYFARRLVMERLREASEAIPAGLGEPTLGPITTGLGNVLMYEVQNVDGADHSLMELRTAQDWIVKPMLQTVPGVTAVLSVGGYVRQYQIQVDAEALLARGLTLLDVQRAVGADNRNVGASFIERGGEEYIVRGYGWFEPGEQGLADIRNVVVDENDGIPVTVGDVATVAFGAEIRRGTLLSNGEEAVGGFVLKLIYTNTADLLDAVEVRITEINAALPDGMEVVPFYSQGDLVGSATGTVVNSLISGAALVLLVLYFFMGDVRSTLILVSTIPIAFLIAFIGMNLTGLSANLMTLGALAISIGMIADGSTVVLENAYRLLEDAEEERGRSTLRIVEEAAREVGRPVIFATTTIIVVFLPLFSLQGVEGKMFKPMAYTIVFALLGAMLLAITYTPVIASLLASRGAKGGEPRLVRWLKARFRPLAEWAVERPKRIVGTVLVAFAASLAVFPFLGTEFVPTLREGTFAIRAVLPPSANLPSTIDYASRIADVASSFEEVEGVRARVGRAEVGGDPEPVNVVFNVVDLAPLDEWTGEYDYEGLQSAMAARLQEELPGVSANFSQPIQLRTDELLSGVRAQVVVSIYGEDLDELQRVASEVEAIASSVEGAVDVRAQQQAGKPQVLIRPDRAELARLGIGVESFLSTVEAGVGGATIGQVFEGIRRFSVFLRLKEEHRTHVEQVRQLPIRTASGALVPLGRVADVEVFTGPKQISRNRASRRTYVQLNVRGRDMGSVVEEIQSRVAAEMELPTGYFVEYGGQFENQERAMDRLYVVVPITLGLIFFILFSTYGSPRYATLIFLNVPFAVIGGIMALFVGGMYLSVPAAVGFIAVFGVAVLNGVVLVTYINQLRDRGMETATAVIRGAELRLRPVLMTALTTSLGLLPLLLADDIGANVQRPLAAVVIGGLITSTLLTLFVLPTVYPWFAEAELEEVEL